MLVFYFYTQWNYEKVESWLSAMEQKGFRLVTNKWCWWFLFTRSKPRTTNYLFLYNFIKESAMLPYEFELRSKYSANQIKSVGTVFYATIYRITDLNQDLSYIIQFRNHYLRHVFIQKIFCASLLFVPCILGALFTVQSAVAIDYVYFYFFIAVGSLSFAYMLWYCFGFCCILKKLPKR